MKHHKSEDRTESLQRLIPDLYDYKTVLYIGARTDRFDYGKDFRAYNYEITVLEAFETNVNYLKSIDWLKEVIHVDVRNFVSTDEYDIVFWWHGPEHIPEDHLKPVLNNLEIVANKAVVLGCPWGISKQGTIDGNPFESHVSHYDHKIFEELGYTVECLGIKDVRGSNITAVKYIK